MIVYEGEKDMKKEYVTPMMAGERFAPNEYVAACGDSGKVYKFVCDAPAGTVYCDKDGDGQMERIGGYVPCAKPHEASAAEVFKLGFVDRNRNGSEDDGEAAYIWLEYKNGKRGPYIYNWHATTNLNMETWETAKS